AVLGPCCQSGCELVPTPIARGLGILVVAEHAGGADGGPPVMSGRIGVGGCGGGTVVEEHRNVVGRLVGDREVLVVVVVEVADRHTMRPRAGGVCGRSGKVAVRGAHQHRDIVGARVGDRQIVEGVTVEVAHRHGARRGVPPSDAVGGPVVKGAVGLYV